MVGSAIQVWVSTCYEVPIATELLNNVWSIALSHMWLYKKKERLRFSKWVHLIMEAEESQNLQSASWRPRRVDSVVLVWVWKPEKTRRAKGVDSVWMWTGSRPRKCWFFSLSLNAEKNLSPTLKVIRQKKFYLILGRISLLFSSGLQLTKWGLQIRKCFTQYFKMLVIQKHSQGSTQNNIWPNIWELHGLVKTQN